MPRVHRCSEHNCRRIIPIGERYCDEHKPERDPMSDKDYAHRRKHDGYRQAQIKFYNSKRWHSVQANVMDRDHGVCQYCLMNGIVTVAKMVDHVVPREVNMSLELDENNLKSACWACHRKKTIWEQKHYGTGKGNCLKSDAIQIRHIEYLKNIFDEGA